MPAVLPPRTMRYDSAKRMLTLSIPKSSKKTEVSVYQVEEPEKDEAYWDHPVRCFRVTNLGSMEVYDVVVDTQQQEEPGHSCDCPGFTGHGHKGIVCKHIAALVELVRRGKV